MSGNVFHESRRSIRRLRVGAACLVLGGAVATARAEVVFNVAFDASASMLTADERAEITSHIQEAGRRWVAVIGVAGSRSIEVNVAIDTIPTANGASATTAFIGTIGGRDTYEQGVASELRTGVDPNDAAPDANITFGLDYLRNELWFDPDPASRTAPVPTNRTDAMSTVLHEFGHVLAYNGWADLNDGTPTQPYWSIFDTWIVPGTPPRFAGPAAVAAWGNAPALTVGNIFHWGNAAALRASEAARCVAPRVRENASAPVPLACGTPESADAPASRDIDWVLGGPDLINQLMNGVVFYRGTRYDISALDLGVLRDVGLIADADTIFGNGFDPAAR